MKITLEPTGHFETVSQETGKVLCRIWKGATESGAKIIALIPLVAVHNDATKEEHEAFEKALREVKAERELVSFDIRMAVD